MELINDIFGAALMAAIVYTVCKVIKEDRKK